MIITFIFIIINMEKSVANITINVNYDYLKIKNKRLLKLKKLPKNAEVSALALISKYLIKYD